MQALSPVSTSTAHAPLTIDPATLLGARVSASPNPAPIDSIPVKQEPDEEAILRDATKSASVSQGVVDAVKQNGADLQVSDVKGKAKHQSTSLVDDLLMHDHNAILRPDLSAFADARDAMRRLLPYHVWNIPHHDLLHSLGLKHDPVLDQVRSTKRRRVARLQRRGQSASPEHVKTEAGSVQQSLPSAQTSADAGPSSITADAVNGTQIEATAADQDDADTKLQLDHTDVDVQLNDIGLPFPLPEIPLPEFPTLAYAESVFSRRHSLAARFRRTLTALDTTHKRAPNTSISLEHLERLAYNDDREHVLAQIEQLKALKAKLEELEQTKAIDATQSSATINLSFGITDEIERERERERELERIKRQQERAAAKAAKLEKEREARHRLGIFTPPPEQPAPTQHTTPSASAPAPAASSAAPPTSMSLPLPTSYSSVSTPASTPGGFPFPPGASLPYAQPGSNGFAMPSPFSAPGSAYSSMPATPYGSFAATPGAPAMMPNGMSSMGTPTSAPSMPAPTSMPGAPSTPAATPSKPPSKSRAKPKASAVTPTAGAPGTPGVTPGPTPHRGRGRPRKHPLPGTPGGPPLGSSVPRKKKEKAAVPGTPGTPTAAGSSAMSPPTALTGAMQVRPSSASPVPPTMPGPAPGYSGEMFVSTLPPTPVPARPAAAFPGASATSATVHPPTMHPTLTSATSLNTPRAMPPVASGSTSTPAQPPAKKATPKAAPNGISPRPSSSAPTSAPAAGNPSIPNHPIPLLIPVSSLPRLSALGIQPTPSPHIRPIIGPNRQPQGLQGLPIPIDPNQSVPAMLLGISEGTAEAGTEAKQQILHISVVLSRLSPSQLSGLAVLMQSLQAQVEANKAK